MLLLFIIYRFEFSICLSYLLIVVKIPWPQKYIEERVYLWLRFEESESMIIMGRSNNSRAQHWSISKKDVESTNRLLKPQSLPLVTHLFHTTIPVNPSQIVPLSGDHVFTHNEPMEAILLQTTTGVFFLFGMVNCTIRLFYIFIIFSI